MTATTTAQPTPSQARAWVTSNWRDTNDKRFRDRIREMSNAALYDYAEGLFWAIDTPGSNPETDPDLRNLIDRGRERDLRVCQQEIARRRQLVAVGRKYPKIFTPHFNRLREACQRIREEVDLEDVVMDAGVAIRLGKKESHAACPICGGNDRFVLFHAPNSRGWCRRCGFQTDVIGYGQSIWRCTFAEAVERIAERHLGMTLAEARV
jgi:hypothetical protein